VGLTPQRKETNKRNQKRNQKKKPKKETKKRKHLRGQRNARDASVTMRECAALAVGPTHRGTMTALNGKGRVC
jgi:hypothetical protein